MSPVETFVRIPPCRGCGRKMTLDGKPPYGSRLPADRFARRYPDRYRGKRERGRNSGRCYPGKQGTCNAYHFPHRRGPGYCVHNPKMTADKLREREDPSWSPGDD